MRLRADGRIQQSDLTSGSHTLSKGVSRLRIQVKGKVFKGSKRMKGSENKLALRVIVYLNVGQN
jgi:hypothetical protein